MWIFFLKNCTLNSSWLYFICKRVRSGCHVQPNEVCFNIYVTAFSHLIFFQTLSRKEFKKMVSVLYGFFNLKTISQHTTITLNQWQDSITTHHRHPCTKWTNKHTSRYKKQTNCKNSFCLSNNSSLQKNLRLNVYYQNTLSPGSVKGAIPPHPTPSLQHSWDAGLLGVGVRTLAPWAHLRPSERKMMSQMFHCFLLILFHSLVLLKILPLFSVPFHFF